MKQHHLAFYKMCQVCEKEFTIYAEYFNHLRYCEPEQKPLLKKRKVNTHGKVSKVGIGTLSIKLAIFFYKQCHFSSQIYISYSYLSVYIVSSGN